MNPIISLTIETILTHSIEVLSSEIDDETILLSIKNSKYYGMASTGNRIWGLLASPIAIAEIIDILSQEYVIDKERCKIEVFEFLSELLTNNLITVVK